MLRCWDCKRLVPLAEREVPVGGGPYPQQWTAEVICNCGARYVITTTRMPSVKPRQQPEQEPVEVSEEVRLWQR